MIKENNKKKGEIFEEKNTLSDKKYFTGKLPNQIVAHKEGSLLKVIDVKKALKEFWREVNKMKPEPLKGKVTYNAERYGDSNEVNIELIKEDIKSAVEWLKKEIRDKVYQIQTNSNEYESKELLMKIINQAFEDVTRKIQF